MLSFAIKYRPVIDAMTADKSVKLQKFELDFEEWGIAEDLVSVLQVWYFIYFIDCVLTLFHSNTRMRPCFSHKIRPVLPPSSLLWTG